MVSMRIAWLRGRLWTWLGLGLCGTLAVVVFSKSVWAAHPDPIGLVEAPAFGTYTLESPEDVPVHFQGWVTFPGSEGRVDITVQRFGNTDAREYFDSGWAIVATAIPSNEFTIVLDGNTFRVAYRWEANVHLFRAKVGGDEPLPPGGIARIRFSAVHQNPAANDETESFLRVRDRDGVIGQAIDLGEERYPQFFHYMIFADNDPTPANPPDDDPDDGNPPNVPPYLTRKPVPPDAKKVTERYYKALSTDPEGFTRKKGSIWEALKTEIDFLKRYIFTKDRVYAKTRYYNQGDLGIGRFMQCSYTPLTQETACIVRNYGRFGGRALFGNFFESQVAISGNSHFASVAMVHRGKMPLGAPNKVFFVVYDSKGKLATEALLDNKGFNRSIPSNCLVCHGSGGRFDPRTLAVTGAYFLPFDLASFRFFSSSFLPPRLFSRAEQEDDFKTLNRIVLTTETALLPHAAELIRGWYGGQAGLEDTTTTFKDDFIPGNWRFGDVERQLYRHVVAPTCRGCHLSHPTLNFGTPSQFFQLRDFIYNTTCRSHEMPHAEQTLINFWRSDARPQLLNRLKIPLNCGVPIEPRARPGTFSTSQSAPLGTLSTEQSLHRTSDVFLDRRAGNLPL